MPQPPRWMILVGKGVRETLDKASADRLPSKMKALLISLDEEEKNSPRNAKAGRGPPDPSTDD